MDKRMKKIMKVSDKEMAEATDIQDLVSFDPKEAQQAKKEQLEAKKSEYRAKAGSGVGNTMAEAFKAAQKRKTASR